MRCKRAFTLVELLVVIAVIAILIALLLPLVNRVKRQAQEVVCQANLRSIGQAMTLYVQQWRYYPGGLVNSSNPMGNCAVWPVRLRNAIGGNQKIFYCPARGPEYIWSYDIPGEHPVTTADVKYGYKPKETALSYTHAGRGEGQKFSYSYNIYGIWWDDGDEWSPSGWAHPLGLGGYLGSDASDLGKSPYAAGNMELKATHVRRPSEMIAVADNDYSTYILNPIHLSRWPARIHRGGANVLFCDGHVQWYLQKDLIVGDKTGGNLFREWHTSNELIRKYWNNDNDPHNTGPW
jgi:prepilin-type processing-associated H-X9-DG protein/prepilin-type N-terminal cleavage/methylation domain-containing protein